MTNGRLEKFNDTLVQILARLQASPFKLMYGREARLPHDAVYDILRAPPTDEEIQHLQHKRLEHVQDLDRVRQESNARALRRLNNDAARRDDTYRERGFAIGDLVKRKSETSYSQRPHPQAPIQRRAS